MTNLKIVIIVLLYSPLFSEAIFGGSPITDPHKYPWLSKLYIIKENGVNSECGGSILTENVIITAAHCVLNVSKIAVLVGHPNITSEEIFATSVKSLIIHPDYNRHGKFRGDLALLQLHTNLCFNKSIQPIALPKNDLPFLPKNDLPLPIKTVFEELIEEIEALKNKKASKSTKFFVAGWGKSWNFTDESISKFFFKSFYYSNFDLHEEYSKWMEELTTNARTSIILKEIQLQLFRDDSYKIAAQGIFPLWQGVCNGDSGSPLMEVKEDGYELVGITSTSSTTCTRLAYYTKVSKYLTWIYKNLRKFDPQYTKYPKKPWKPKFIFQIFFGIINSLVLILCSFHILYLCYKLYELYYSKNHQNGFNRLTIFTDFPMSRCTMITVFGFKIICLSDWCILCCWCILPTLCSSMLGLIYY